MKKEVESVFRLEEKEIREVTLKIFENKELC
jgi:hypothetical protein